MATLAEMREQDEKDRQELLKETQQDVKLILTNREGLRRLLAITDEEWAAAEVEGQGAA